MERITSFYSSDRRYASLRVLGVVSMLLGAVLLAVGALLLVYGLYALAQGMLSVSVREAAPLAAVPGNAIPLAPWLNGSLALLWSFFLLLMGLQNLAMGALFQLMIHLEENTRASAQFLDRIRSRVESSPEGVEPWFRS
jgi:hypothetical protein